MVYYTGDLHGNPREVIDFCERQKLTEQDTLILLGDVGANYGLDKRDEGVKKRLNAVKPYLMCIHGNHEIRPANIPTYHTQKWNGGMVWMEDAYPRLLFAADGEIFKDRKSVV